MLAREFCVFRSHWSILPQWKGLGLIVFINFNHFTALRFFSSRLCSRILLGLTLTVVNEILMTHLRCCYPATTSICLAGSILIKGQGYLSLTRPPSVGNIQGESRKLLEHFIYKRLKPKFATESEFEFHHICVFLYAHALLTFDLVSKSGRARFFSADVGNTVDRRLTFFVL